MANFTLTCCSTADRPKSFFDGRPHSLCVLPLERRAGQDHLDDLYQSVSPSDFYAAIKAGATPTTSQVSVGEFVELWEPIVAAGSDVLHVSLSSGLSGAYGSACLAATQVMEAHPERRVLVVDSLGASSGYGMLVDYLADKRDEGVTLDEAFEWAMENRLRVHHWFFSTDLSSYVRGGRVSRVSGFVGTALKICPVLNMNDEGKLIPRDKIRTKAKAAKDMVARMEEHVQDGHDYAGKCSLSMSACREDAEAVRDMVESQVLRRLRARCRSTTLARSSARTRVPAPSRCSSWETSAGSRGFRRPLRRPVSPMRPCVTLSLWCRGLFCGRQTRVVNTLAPILLAACLLADFPQSVYLGFCKRAFSDCPLKPSEGVHNSGL